MWKLWVLVCIGIFGNAPGILAQFSYDLVPYLDGRLYGFADIKGNVVIKPDFEKVSPFDTLGFAEVEHYGLKGKINRKGEWAIPPIANNYKLTPVKNFNGQNMEEVKGAYWVTEYNQKRMTYFNEYRTGSNKDIYSSSHRGLRYLRKENYRHFTDEIFEYGMKKVVFKDSSTNLLKIDGTYFYNKNQYDVEIVNEHLVAKAINPTTFQIFDYQDQLMNSDTFTRIAIENGGKYLIASKGEYEYFLQSVVLDKKGEKLIDGTFNKVRYLLDDLFFVADRNGNRVIDEKGKVIIKACGEEVIPACEKYVGTNRNDSLFLFTKKGELVLALKGGELKYGNTKNYFIVTTKDQQLLYNNNAEIIFKLDGGRFYVQPGLDIAGELILSQEGGEIKSLFSTKGKKIFEVEGEITPMFSHQAYFVRSKAKVGIYSPSKGWVYPLAYQRLSYSYGDRILYKNKNGKNYLVDFEFMEIEKEKATHDYVMTFNEKDSLHMVYPNGEMVSVPASYNIRPLSVEGSDDERLYWSNKNDKSVLLNSRFANILPQGFQVHISNEYTILQNKKVGIWVSDGSRIGLINSKGKWLIEPMIAQRFREKEHGIYMIQNQNKIVYFNKNFKEIPLNEGQNLNILDDKLVALYDRNLDHRLFNVCDHELNMLSEITFSGCNYQKNIFLKKIDENGVKKTCFYNSSFQLDTCLSFQHIEFTHDSQGRMIVYSNERYGVMDADKKLIIPLSYKIIEYKSPFYFLHDDNGNTSLLTENNEIKNLDCKMEYPELDKESGYYFLRNYGERKYMFVDKNAKIISRLEGDLELMEKDNYYFFKEMLLSRDSNYKPFYVHKYSGVVYRNIEK